MNKLLSGSALFFVLISLVQISWADEETEQLKRDVLELKKGQESMQNDLAEIKKLLKSGAKAGTPQKPFEPTEFVLKDPNYMGKKDAPVTIIEFSDYQCPYCARHYKQTMPELMKQFVDVGKVKFVMKENPLSFHKQAMGASTAALCAGEQGKYFEMHNILFENQKKLSIDDLKSYAETLKLDSNKFNACLDDGKHVDRINADIAEGRKLGIRGTPGFVLGLTDSKDSSKVNLTKFIKGAQGINSFSEVIEDLLRSE